MTAALERPPLAGTAGAKAPSPVLPPIPETILIADDDENIRDLVAFKLQFAGYRVITADNGHDALTRAQRERPDLIVLDVAMPGMDGIDVCYQLRAAPETAHIPVLMLSARTQPTDIDLAHTVGADDYLPKPFQGPDLIQRIRWLLLAAA